jgi:SAM-dependent methyltransferase
MAEPGDREQRRRTFGTVPELYDRARPPYPEEVYDDLVAFTNGRRLLEIGCGTGLATRTLVDRGFDVTCVELSSDLAALARNNVPQAQVVVADVELWSDGEFDVVASFTAFHWLNPDTRFRTAARLLRPGGALAVVHTHHVRNDDPFWLDSQADYDAVVPGPDNGPPPLPEEAWRFEVDTSVFAPVASRRYLVEIEYSPDDYIALVGTYSNNLVLTAAERDKLFRRLHARIAARGSVRKSFLYELTIAHLR